MTEARLRYSGLVLRRDTAGERHLRLVVLDPEHGVVALLYKPASKAGAATVTPDLFDEAEIFPDSPRTGGRMPFVKEYRLVHRHSGLGRDYARLTLATRLAGILEKNPHPPESHARIHALAGEAFGALAEKKRPDAAYFKTLWLLAREGGWPVREDFLPKLSEGERDLATHLLTTPLATLTADDATAPLVAGLTGSLERWLEREAHHVIG